MAIGCTIGAGLSGVSTLSVASILALISILGGGVLGYRLLGWNAQSHASRKMVPAEWALPIAALLGVNNSTAKRCNLLQRPQKSITAKNQIA